MLSDMKFFEETNVRFFQAMYEFDGTKNRFTVLVDQSAEPFEYDEVTNGTE